MHLVAVAGVLALTGPVAALSDSFPYALLSTYPLKDTPNSNQIQPISEVLQYTKDYLAACPVDRYLIVAQPGARAADFRQSHACALPHLCQVVEDERTKAKYTVAEVIGDVKDHGLAGHIKSACAEKNKEVSVESITLSMPSSDARDGDLKENDVILARSLEATVASGSYTVLFFSTFAEPIYEPEFVDLVQMELKRYVHSSPRGEKDEEEDWNKLSLFEKYQFFTPGIFMALIVAIILFSILGVGILALSSLEVSYGAFEKEMGPAAQKKQQ